MKRPQKGDVWQYEYLWYREHEAGKENTRKSRPTALVTTFVGKDGHTNLFWIPITSKEPYNLNSAVGAKQSSGKLLMLNQCLCLESSTMANPFGEAL